MRGFRFFLGVLGVPLFCGQNLAQVAIYEFGNLGGAVSSTYPEGMSSGGEIVVGRSFGPDGFQAFRWDLSTQTMTGLEHGLGSDVTRTRAYDVNTDGSIIVGECTLANGYTQGMIWDGAGSHLISSDYGTAIHGISDNGQAMAIAYTFQDGLYKKVVAHLWKDYGTPGDTLIPMPLWEPPIQHPPSFLTGSVPYDISADGQTMVGISQTSMARNAVRWVYRSPDGSSNPRWIAHTFEDYPESESSYAYGLNHDGTIVVGLTQQNLSANENDPDWQWRAFKWTEANGLEFLPPLPGHNYSEARAISSDGSIIGGTSGIDAPEDAVYWSDGTPHRVADEMEIPDGWHLSGVNAINNIGTRMTGWGSNGNDHIGWVVTGLFRDALQDAVDRGDGWAESDWYGFFWRAGKSHVWHFAHGWQYVPKGNRDSVMVYDFGLGEWVWNNEQTYPFLYMYGDNPSWMWFYKGTQPGDRWFFHYGKNKWMTEKELSGQ